MIVLPDCIGAGDVLVFARYIGIAGSARLGRVVAMANWFYSKGGQQHGPVNSVGLKELADSGRLHPDDLVWKEGMAQWGRTSHVEGLFVPSPAKPAVDTPNEAVSPAPLQYETPARFRGSPVGTSRPAIASLACAGLIPVMFLCTLYGWVEFGPTGNHTDPPIYIMVFVSLFFWLFAHIFGIIGIRDTRGGQRGGRGLAIAGLVLATIFMLIASFLVVAFYFFGGLAGVRG